MAQQRCWLQSTGNGQPWPQNVTTRKCHSAVCTRSVCARVRVCVVTMLVAFGVVGILPVLLLVLLTLLLLLAHRLVILILILIIIPLLPLLALLLRRL